MKKLCFLTIFFCSAVFAAPVEFNQFDSSQQEADYQQLIQALRCPQCQNNNIADSNATIATDMREKTLELLKQGKSKEEIVNYMVARYGHFVTYDPPLTPATLLLWVLPIGLLLSGGWLVWRRKAQSKQAVGFTQNFAKPELDQARLNRILNHKDNQ